MNIPFDEILKALIAECYSRRNMIIAVFCIISLALLGVGTIWPKKYTSYSIIHIHKTNILQSLMRGTAESTKPVDHVANAREIIYGDKIISAILHDAHWLNKEVLSDVEQEKLKQDIKKHIKIEKVGQNLIKISYVDSNPSRAFVTAKRLAELFVAEGEKSKSKESQAAYDFIDMQVKQYLHKLTEVETNLSKFRSENPDIVALQEIDVGLKKSHFDNQPNLLAAVSLMITEPLGSVANSLEKFLPFIIFI